MGNSNTKHSKELRAATAKAAMRKKLADPNYKRITIGGDARVIESFITQLEKTGKKTRIEQLEALIENR